jgi:hypothetical protein
MSNRERLNGRNWMGVVYNYDDPVKHHNFGNSGDVTMMSVFKRALVDTGIVGIHIKYMCYGLEVCPQTGTKHMQCYFQFKHEKSLAHLRKQFSEWFGFECTIAFKVADNNAIECVKYCRKDGQFCDFGQPPKGKGHRSDLQTAIDIISNGGNIQELAMQEPEAFIKYSNGLIKLSMFYVKPRDFMTEVYWVYGPTGTGKSRWVYDQVDKESYYFKNATTKWWCGYAGQKDVVLDDFRPNKEMPFEYMLNLMDRYPMMVEMKGGTTHFLAQRLFVTAPCEPKDVWSHCEWLKDEQLNQFTRRIKYVIAFPHLNCLASHQKAMKFGEDALNQSTETNADVEELNVMASVI